MPSEQVAERRPGRRRLLAAIILVCAVLTATTLLAGRAGLSETVRNLGDRLEASWAQLTGGGDTAPAIKIAVVGDLNNDTDPTDRATLQGVRMFVEEFNAALPPDGARLEVVPIDDGGDTERAAEVATQIGLDDEIVATIGHGQSATSRAGAHLYRLYKMPTVAPTSTNPNITLFNDWYFRVIFNDEMQAKVLANYIRYVLDYQSVAVIADESTYARTLLRVFTTTANDIALNVGPLFTIGETSDEADLQDVARRLTLMDRLDAVLLVVYPDDAARVLPLLRRAGVRAELIGTDSVSSAVVRDAAAASGLPGYLEDVLLTVPFVPDTASLGARRFLRDYAARHGHVPTWHALFGYDSALVLAEAMARADSAVIVAGGDAARIAIRDNLAAMREPETGAEGLAGPIYFNADGDIVRPIYLSRVERGQPTTARQQLRLIEDQAMVALLRQQGEDAIAVDDTLLQITQVVGTGIRLDAISEIDTVARTFRAQFDVWFRFTGQFDATKVRFPDAVQPILLEAPVRTIELGRETYQVFAVDAVFRYTLSADAILRSEQAFPLHYLHAERDLNRLVLLPDLRAMGAAAARTTWADRLRDDEVLDPSSGWIVAGATISQEILNRSTLGNPLIPTVEIPFSTFMATVQAQRGEVSLRGAVGALVPEMHSWVALGTIALALALTFTRAVRRAGRLLTVPLRIGLSALLLLGLEDLAVELVRDRLEVYQLAALANGFAALWWLLPAVWAILLLRSGVWGPMEQRTGVAVPGIAKTLVDVGVLAIAIGCILAFVFDRPLTSLWAASGALTLVVGFALQSLILDAFSGLMIAVERPFAKGHWIAIEHRFVGTVEGRVEEINWRSTRLWTRDNNMVSIPNSAIASAQLVNQSSPTRATRLEVPVVLDHEVPVPDALATLTEAARSVVKTAPGLMDEPEPKAVVEAIEPYGVKYLVQVFRDAATLSQDAATTKIVDIVGATLRERGLQLAVPRERISVDHGVTTPPPHLERTA